MKLKKPEMIIKIKQQNKNKNQNNRDLPIIF